MIKIIGIILVFTVCTGCGLLKSNELSKRVRQLEAFQGALSQISNEIRYFATPTEILMSKIDALEEFKCLKVFGLCKKNMENIRDFTNAWELSLKEAKPYLALNNGDHETLLWFGKVLGTTDIEGETANCERYGNLLSQRIEVAREDQVKRSKMYSSLGVLAGIFLSVLLL